MLSLCLPFMGFACGKSPLMRVLIFFGKPFEASPENEPSPSKSHYGKTKYGDKKLPAVVKKGWRITPFRRMNFLRPQGAILNYILSLAYSDSRYENDNLLMDGR